MKNINENERFEIINEIENELTIIKGIIEILTDYLDYNHTNNIVFNAELLIEMIKTKHNNIQECINKYYKIL